MKTKTGKQYCWMLNHILHNKKRQNLMSTFRSTTVAWSCPAACVPVNMGFTTQFCLRKKPQEQLVCTDEYDPTWGMSLSGNKSRVQQLSVCCLQRTELGWTESSNSSYPCCPLNSDGLLSFCFLRGPVVSYHHAVCSDSFFYLFRFDS